MRSATLSQGCRRIQWALGRTRRRTRGQFEEVRKHEKLSAVHGDARQRVSRAFNYRAVLRSNHRAMRPKTQRYFHPSPSQSPLTMTPFDTERWNQIWLLFDRMRALPRLERGAQLREACADDDAMRLKVLQLLQCDDSDELDDIFLAPAFVATLWMRSPRREAASPGPCDERAGPGRVRKRRNGGSSYRATRRWVIRKSRPDIDSR